MHWLNWIKGVLISAKGVITASLTLLSKRSPEGTSRRDENRDDGRVEDRVVTDVKCINPEELAGKLSRYLPGYQSSQEKEDEIQELKNTIIRLQQRASNEFKKAAIQALSKEDVTKAAEHLKKSARYRTIQSEQPAREAALDWIDIGNITYLINPQKALTVFRKAVKLDSLNTDAWHRLGRVAYWSGNLQEAQNAYEQILNLAGKDKVLQAICSVNLGTIYKKSGMLDKAEEFYIKSIELNEALGRQEDMAFASGNLGIIYYKRGEYEKAEECYLESLEINEALNRQECMAVQYCNLGIVYKERGELDRAEEFYQKSLKINKSLGQKRGMASNYCNLGNIYKIRDQVGKACSYWGKSYDLFSDINVTEQINLTAKLIADNCNGNDR